MFTTPFSLFNIVKGVEAINLGPAISDADNFTLPPAALETVPKKSVYHNVRGEGWADQVDSPTDDRGPFDEYGRPEPLVGLNLEARTPKDVDNLDQLYLAGTDTATPVVPGPPERSAGKAGNLVRPRLDAIEEYDLESAVSAPLLDSDAEMKDVPGLSTAFGLVTPVKSEGIKAEPGEKAAKRTSGPPGSASGHVATKTETAE